jgi:hypothetical protein
MWRKTFGLFVCFLLITAAWAQETPNYDYAYFVTNDQGYIVGDNVYDAPEFGDWDDDGDLDMMVGVFYSGNVLYYENVSTGVIPEFGPEVMVTADGSPIAVSYG